MIQERIFKWIFVRGSRCRDAVIPQDLADFLKTSAGKSRIAVIFSVKLLIIFQQFFIKPQCFFVIACCI